jgi:hypothetical protein
MTLEEAFNLTNNFDVKEKLRPFAPQWSTVVVSRNGEIVDVIRHKEQPSLRLNKEHMERYPDSVQFTAWPSRFRAVGELRKEIEKCVWVHGHK